MSRTMNMHADRLTGAQRTHNGYTLIELLMVVGLLGLAATLLIPHLVGRDVMAAESAVRALISDMHFAQSDALAHQELRRLYFYDDGTGYCIYRVTPASFSTEFDPEDVDYISDPISGLGAYIVDYTKEDRWEGLEVESVSIDGGHRYISYDELGGTAGSAPDNPGTGGTIVLRMDDERYRLTIAPFTGKIDVEKIVEEEA